MIRQRGPGLGPNQLTSERYSKTAGGGGVGGWLCVCVRGDVTQRGSGTAQTGAVRTPIHTTVRKRPRWTLACRSGHS